MSDITSLIKRAAAMKQAYFGPETAALVSPAGMTHTVTSSFLRKLPNQAQKAVDPTPELPPRSNYNDAADYAALGAGGAGTLYAGGRTAGHFLDRKAENIQTGSAYRNAASDLKKLKPKLQADLGLYTLKDGKSVSRTALPSMQLSLDPGVNPTYKPTAAEVQAIEAYKNSPELAKYRGIAGEASLARARAGAARLFGRASGIGALGLTGVAALSSILGNREDNANQRKYLKQLRGMQKQQSDNYTARLTKLAVYLRGMY